MLSKKCLKAYELLYPDDICIYGEPSNLVTIIHDGVYYDQPEDETDETFMERIKRCKETGENVFVKEWPVQQDDDDDRLY